MLGLLAGGLVTSAKVISAVKVGGMVLNGVCLAKKLKDWAEE